MSDLGPLESRGSAFEQPGEVRAGRSGREVTTGNRELPTIPRARADGCARRRRAAPRPSFRRRAAAAPRPRRCRAPAPAVRAPGIAQVTASNIRIQRSASCVSVAPGGTSGRSSLDGLEADVVRHARERLSLVERLTLAIEVAVVVGGEHRVAPQLAGQQAARQRHAREDADLPSRSPRGARARRASAGTC